MSKIDPKYASFYLDGRDKNSSVTIDLDEIAKQVLLGADLQVATHLAAQNALAPLANTEKKKWAAKHKAEIDGLSVDVAWEHFHSGRVDALAYLIDDDVLDAIEAATEEDDEPEDEGVEGEQPDDQEEGQDGEEDDGDDEDDDDDDEEEP